MDTYGTEAGDILFSIQALLIREEEEGGPAPSVWRQVQVPHVAVTPGLQGSAPHSAPRVHRPASGRRGAPVELRLIDPETGAGSLAAMRRELSLLGLDRPAANSSFGLYSLRFEGLDTSDGEGSQEMAASVMRALSDIAPFELRRTDRLYRIDSHQMALLLDGTDYEGAEAAATRLQDALHRILSQRKLPLVSLLVSPLDPGDFVQAEPDGDVTALPAAV